MRTFSITEAQLDELAGLNDETAAESRRKDEIVAEVKAQELISASPQNADLPVPDHPSSPSSNPK